MNTAGALLTAGFGTEVARGQFGNWNVDTKFGRVVGVDIASGITDIWNGAGTYTGFNATANQNIRTFSASTSDVGLLVTSGTATGGSQTTIVNTGVNFTSLGVVVGDLVINDTTHSHGFVTAVTATTLTVYRMTNGAITQSANASGNSYRVARATSTGAGVVRVDSILNSSYEEQNPVYVILNGTTPVISTTSAMRCSRAKVISSGSSGRNVGSITISQATTTANVFAVMPLVGRTAIACHTVPINKIMLIKRLRIAIVRANGSAGSANINLNVREPYGAWQAVRTFELQTGATTEFSLEGGLVLMEGTDIKFTVRSVSDNGTTAEGAFEYYLITE